MKNRKSILVVFLLVAAMLMSVGYAALTDELGITGDLKTDTTQSMAEFDADVYFFSANIVTDETGNQSVAQVLEGRDDAKIQALHFTEKDQVVKAKFVITNDPLDEFAAKIAGSSVSVSNNGGHEPIFTVTWSWQEDSIDTNDIVLKPGESQDLFVTITLKETPQEIHQAEFSVSYTATAEEVPQG